MVRFTPDARNTSLGWRISWAQWSGPRRLGLSLLRCCCINAKQNNKKGLNIFRRLGYEPRVSRNNWISFTDSIRTGGPWGDAQYIHFFLQFEHFQPLFGMQIVFIIIFMLILVIFKTSGNGKWKGEYQGMLLRVRLVLFKRTRKPKTIHHQQTRLTNFKQKGRIGHLNLVSSRF